MNVQGKNVVIYGGGISGLSAYQLVKEKGGRVMIYDDYDRPHTTSSAGVFARADLIVLSPGIESGNPYVLDARLEGKTVVSEIELASSFCVGEQIAVTGTNGKTTTVTLIDHILKCAHVSSRAVGNIGVAFSSIADKLDALDTAVVEVSSFQLESVRTFSPDYAVLLNITPDHLDRHQTFERYVSAKSNIFMHQCECDVVVYNDDDKVIKGLVPYMKGEKIPFSATHPVDGAYLSSGFVCYKGMIVVELADLDVKGADVENVLAAVAVTMRKGISKFTVATALCSYKRPQYRRQKVAEVNGISVFNDSKATNVASTLSAVSAMDGDTVLLVGGAKGSEDFDKLFCELSKKVVAVVAYGENREDVFASADKYGFSATVADNLEDAVLKGMTIAVEQGANNLLLSPASKSFDSFKNYEERGKFFDKVIVGLK